MKITLTNPKTVTIRPAVAAVTTTITEINVLRIVDTGDSVFADLVINATAPKKITLWEGAAYISIGDWTQAQANARIEALLK